MNSQDLRIGNLILVNDVLQEVCQIPLPENCTEENTKPIPLTEEWILKLGFIKKIGNHGEYYAHNKYSGFRVWKSNATSCWVIGRKQFDNNSTYWIVDLKNINQIQNLFYDLTGEELKATL